MPAAGAASCPPPGRHGRTQEECAAIARLSQPRWSDLERGRGANAPLETWAVAASAVGQELVAFLDQAPGADLPRDIEHLRRQSVIVERAAVGGWAVAPEMPVTAGISGRVIDALLTRAAAREAAVFEVWDLLLDVGQSFRSFDEKVAAVRRTLSGGALSGGALSGWTVSGEWVIRGTRRNRSLVAELAPSSALDSRGREPTGSAPSTARPLPCRRSRRCSGRTPGARPSARRACARVTHALAAQTRHDAIRHPDDPAMR
jgi:hypothetical protein